MADYQYINSTGVVVPDTSDLLAQVQLEFKNAFGSDLNIDPSTPQGLLITGETTARKAVINNNAALANQINPNLAGGVFLDAICALTRLERDPSTPTMVTATIAGVSGTVIPEGSRAQTQAQVVFQTVSEVTIGGGGTVDANFESVEFGPQVCNIGDLNQIVSGILGWETVNNAAAAVQGTNVQSDQSLRALRKVTLALQGVSLPEAVVSRLYNVPGVTSLAFRENTAATTQTIDGVSMVAHSIYACVNGGTNTDVATALLNTKSGGCAYNGSTTVNVTEPFSGQVYPVKFSRPTVTAFKVRTTVSANSSILDPNTAVPQAILAYVNGEIEGEAGLIVGQDVSVFEMAGAITTLYPGIYVQSMETSVDGGSTWVTTPISIGIDHIATLAPTDIQVTVV